MKVSVLIGAYNMASTLPRALKSVCDQTHGDWEIIVVDDASTDHTAAVIAEARTFPGPVRYERAPQNRGIAATRNRLLALAAGEIFAFLDADDWWSEDHLAKAVRMFAAGADLVASGVETFDLVTHAPLGKVLPPPILEFDPSVALITESVIITSSCVLLTRALASRVGLYDTAFQVGEDRDYWLRASLAGAKFRIQRTATCHYAKHGGSTMAKTRLVTAQAIQFYEKYQNASDLPTGLRRKMLAQSLANEARLLRRPSPGRSLGQLIQAVRLNPLGCLGLIRRVLSP
jgi:glycosyltransferase involved in cell wall biosynthesis